MLHICIFVCSTILSFPHLSSGIQGRIMKASKKIQIISGCVVALSIPAIILLNQGTSEKTSGIAKTEKGKKPLATEGTTSPKVKVVFEAIKNNKVEVFEEYLSNGGKLDEVVYLENNQQVTVAEAIVQYERTDFIQKVVAHNKKVTKAEWQATVKEGNISQTSLGLLVGAVAKMGQPQVKKEFLDLVKEDAQVLAATKSVASEVLPEVVQTCDENEISFLGDLGADPLQKNTDGSSALVKASESKCFKAISYWKKDQNVDFDKKNEEGVTAFDVLAKFKDPELQSFTDTLQEDGVREIASLKAKPSNRVSFYKKRSAPSIIDPEALVEPELRPDEATETAEFSEFSD